MLLTRRATRHAPCSAAPRARCLLPSAAAAGGGASALRHPPHPTCQTPSNLTTLSTKPKRAEHNEGLLSTLEEVALHQQGIERIEPLLARLCPRLRILYLQGNLICTIQHLHRLKDLEYLNLALNNVTRVQNLQRCESLRKLDLTANFVPKAALLGLAACLGGGHALRELHLVGNPCADWEGYRAFVVAALPQLERLVRVCSGGRDGQEEALAVRGRQASVAGQRHHRWSRALWFGLTPPPLQPSQRQQDGQEIRPSERIAASQADTDLRRRLLTELAAEGVDADAAARCEDDGAVDDPEALLDADEVPETGAVDSESGELRRPWCPATRILEHHEAERAAREAEAKRRAAQDDPFAPPPPPPRHEVRSC